MTVTFISTNTTSAGNQFPFAAAGDALVVLPGATLGSTNSSAFTTAFTDNEVTVLGTMVSVAQLALGTSSSFTLGSAGTFLSFQASISLAGLFMNGAGSVAQIDGTFSAPEAVGLLTSGGGQIVTVTGSITAGSAVYLSGSTGNDVLVNSGRITANAQGDVGNGTLFNNAVFVEGQQTRITNLAGGVITATSSEGNGVRLASTAGGSEITNHGTIRSEHAAAVYVSAAGAVTLVNTGLIDGGGNSFDATDSAVVSVQNRGSMLGNVALGIGNDTFDARGGLIVGDWFGDNGNDLYDGRGASQITGQIDGGIGNDTLLGGDFAETINGSVGLDTIRGGGGDDVLSGDFQSDLLAGDGGNDQLYGGSDFDDMSGGTGDDTLAGGDGGLLGRGGDGNDLMTVDNTATAWFATAYGGAGDDTMTGGQIADFIFGGSGEDSIESGLGADQVYGGLGDDSIGSSDGDDSVYGDAGDDVISNGLGNAQLYGGRGFDAISGGDGNDLTDGGADDDTLDGGIGLDTIFGGSGDDQMLGGNDNDSLEGGTGADVILTGIGNDRANGGTGNDSILGENGRDTLNGGAGDDTVVGGASQDSMTGGTGADTFVLTALSDAGTTLTTLDIITDFLSGTDKLDLGALDANTLIAGNDAFTFIGNTAFANTAGELQYAAAFGVLLGDVNGDGTADFRVDFTNLSALTAGDFVL